MWHADPIADFFGLDSLEWMEMRIRWRSEWGTTLVSEWDHPSCWYSSCTCLSCYTGPWSSWIIMDHHGSSWIIMDHHGSSWTIMDHVWWNTMLLVEEQCSAVFGSRWTLVTWEDCRGLRGRAKVPCEGCGSVRGGHSEIRTGASAAGAMKVGCFSSCRQYWHVIWQIWCVFAMYSCNVSFVFARHSMWLMDLVGVSRSQRRKSRKKWKNGGILRALGGDVSWLLTTPNAFVWRKNHIYESQTHADCSEACWEVLKLWSSVISGYDKKIKGAPILPVETTCLSQNCCSVKTFRSEKKLRLKKFGTLWPFFCCCFSSSCSYEISSQTESPEGNDRLGCTCLELLLWLGTGTEQDLVDSIVNSANHWN